MRFLAKDSDSSILKDGLAYKPGGDNRALKERLSMEQKCFCAYSEQRLDDADEVDVEHFQALAQGGNNGYWNVYAVKVGTHRRKTKLDRAYSGHSLFQDRFFQRHEDLRARIKYAATADVFVPIDRNDSEAEALIQLLGVNLPVMVKMRENFIKRVRELLRIGNWDIDFIHAWFRENPNDFQFISALEAHFNLDLTPLLEGSCAARPTPAAAPQP